MENLEKLNGVGKTTADKLKKAGYNTIEAIAMATPAKFSQGDWSISSSSKTDNKFC